MPQLPVSIPRPLVRTNQWVIFSSVVLTWVTGLYGILLIPFIANLLGFLIGFNPIMRAAKFFLKKNKKDYVPEDAQQQRFNSIIATTFLGGGFIGFAAGFPVVGYVFTVMVAVASFVAILGFCVGCFIHFQWNQHIYRRKQKRLLKEN